MPPDAAAALIAYQVTADDSAALMSASARPRGVMVIWIGGKKGPLKGRAGGLGNFYHFLMGDFAGRVSRGCARMSCPFPEFSPPPPIHNCTRYARTALPAYSASSCASVGLSVASAASSSGSHAPVTSRFLGHRSKK